MKPRCVAVLGTGSDVGKSTIAAALCRIFSDMGFRVAPFKAQNMSNNSFVTAEGLEMGRAQVVQAECARVEPGVDMNPILLKPGTDRSSQIVLHGRVAGEAGSSEFSRNRDRLFGEAAKSLARLTERHELIVMEGAGSCAEVNLRSADIANFRMAEWAGASVILAADIDRGGVFAQVVGTLELLTPTERALVKGIVINRFRGDASLFEDGIRFIEERTGLPVLGLIPYFRHIEIDSEDGLPLETVLDPPGGFPPGTVNVAVIRLPHISNFTDFSPLARQKGISLHYLSRPRPLDDADMVILPGSRNVRFDLEWMKKTGWDALVKDFAGRGGMVAGICGGYQMLGAAVSDPYGVEGPPGETEGLSLLDVRTTLQREKRLERVSGVWTETGTPVSGYEIHMGTTERGDGLPAAVLLSDGGMGDGARSPDGRVWGSYLHGIFDRPEFRAIMLERLGSKEGAGEASCGADEFKERQYDLLAEHFRKHMDVERLMSVAGIPCGGCEVKNG